MGLSEREQQMLEEMERQLYRSEADVLKTPESRTRLHPRAVVLGVLLLLAGVGLLLGGASAQQLWLGMVGFGVMLVGALVAFSKTERVQAGGAGNNAPTSTASASSKESLADRMTRRWDQRMEGER